MTQFSCRHNNSTAAGACPLCFPEFMEVDLNKVSEKIGYIHGLEKALSFMLWYHDTIDGHEINYQTIRKIKSEIEKAKKENK